MPPVRIPLPGHRALLQKFPYLPEVAPVALVLLALFFQVLFHEWLSTRTFLLLYPAISMGCLIGNRRSSIIATLVGAWGVWYLFMPDELALLHYLSLGAFLTCGIIVSVGSDLILKGMKEQLQLVEELKKSQTSIQVERENFRDLFRQTPEMVCILSGPEHVFEFVNQAHIQVLGFDATGMKVRVAQPESVEVHGLLDEVYQTGNTAQLIEIPVTVGSKLRFFNLTYSARHDNEGRINGVMILGTEVTGDVQARLDLQAAKDEAVRANQLKSSFLANMSHEIRTPLGAMLGFADLLRDHTLSHVERDNYISILTRNGHQLSDIINDILDLSKVEAGHLNFEFTDTSGQEIARDVISLLKLNAEDKNLSLEFTEEDSTPAQVVTDSLRLRQILFNVIGNAVKFTPAGSIKVRSYGKNLNGKMRLYFEVTDTGIGIPANSHEKVFESFVQADGTLVRKYGGTGLGLALSRQLARKLGGDVRLKSSVEGTGSVFVVSVQDLPASRTVAPSERTPATTSTALTTESLNGVSVLVVDDSPDNRELILHYLQQYGAEIEFAENGFLGYKKALAGNHDVVLMDIQMPEMDGYTATQKLREAGYRMPVIALTAHAMSGVRRKCLLVGCTDHLTKPIKKNDLIEAVARYSV